MAYVEDLVAANPEKFSLQYVDWEKPGGFKMVFSIFMYGFVGVQAFYLLGSVYFARYSFVITTVIGAAVLFAFVLFISYLSDNFLPAGYSWNGASVRNFGEMREYHLSDTVKHVIAAAAKFIWAPLFWTVAWFRLKEKQV
jgi:hypothetical protein